MDRQLKLLQVPHSSFYYKRGREISRTASDESVSAFQHISMDGRGRCLDDAKMERFTRALKYENITSACRSSASMPGIM